MLPDIWLFLLWIQTSVIQTSQFQCCYTSCALCTWCICNINRSTHLWSWRSGCTWAALCHWWCPSWNTGQPFQDRDPYVCGAERVPWHKLHRSQTELSPLVHRMNLSRSARGLKEKRKKNNEIKVPSEENVSKILSLLIIQEKKSENWRDRFENIQNTQWTMGPLTGKPFLEHSRVLLVLSVYSSPPSCFH